MTVRRMRGRLASGGDDGFSLTEALVAIVILAVVAAATAGILLNIYGLTGDSARRSIAANLAATQLEGIRQVSATQIPDGAVVTTQEVDGTPYTLTQEATYLTGSGSSNACSGNGSLAYKRVTVRVSWPDMGNTLPVQSETLRSLGFDASSGGLDATKGALGVRILNHEGKPVPGALVTVRKGTGGTSSAAQQTGTDGCVVFPGLDAGGTYYAQASKSGSVSPRGATVAVDTGNGIHANTLTNGSLSLAPASRITMNLVAPAGATIPTADFGYRLRNSVWTPVDQTFTAAVPCPFGASGTCLDSATSIRNAYPGIYGISIGQCENSVPAGMPNTEVAPGGTTSATVTLGAVRYSALPAGVGVTAQASCGGPPISLGTGSGGPTTFALPQGTWTLTTSTGMVSTIGVVSGQTSTVTVI